MTAAPHRLRVEHLEQGLGITIARPRLSWKLPRLSRTQFAYWVKAGSWDSGRVDSPHHVLVDVAAPPLRPREHRNWRVRVWTDQGRSDWCFPTGNGSNHHGYSTIRIPGRIDADTPSAP